MVRTECLPAPLAVSPPRSGHPAAPSLAGQFTVDRRTVLREVRRRGWLDAQHLIDAGRLLHVGAACARGIVTAVAVARDLGFPSEPALQNFVHRHAGVTFGELHGEAGLRKAIARWVRRR